MVLNSLMTVEKEKVNYITSQTTRNSVIKARAWLKKKKKRILKCLLQQHLSSNSITSTTSEQSLTWCSTPRTSRNECRFQPKNFLPPSCWRHKTGNCFQPYKISSASPSPTKIVGEATHSCKICQGWWVYRLLQQLHKKSLPVYIKGRSLL